MSWYAWERLKEGPPTPDNRWYRQYQRLNAVKYAINNPCNAPWTLYLETFKPAALVAVINLLCFDFLDVARWFFRPKAVRAGSHFQKRKKGGKRRRVPAWRIDLKNKAPAFKEFEGRHVHQGVRNLWMIDGVVQRILWWWLVFDVANEFVYNWSSIIYKTEFCQYSAGDARAAFYGTTNSLPALVGWADLSINNVRYLHGDIQHGAFAVTIPPGNYVIVAAGEPKNKTRPNASFQTRICITDTDGTRCFNSPVLGPDDVDDNASMGRFDVPGNAGIRIQGMLSEGFCDVDTDLVILKKAPLQDPTNWNCDLIEDLQPPELPEIP